MLTDDSWRVYFLDRFFTLMAKVLSFDFQEFYVFGFKFTLFGVWIFVAVGSLLLGLIWDIFGYRGTYYEDADKRE